MTWERSRLRVVLARAAGVPEASKEVEMALSMLSDSLRNVEARRRAAEAAQARHDAFRKSTFGRRQAKAAARDRAALQTSDYINTQHRQRIADIMS